VIAIEGQVEIGDAAISTDLKPAGFARNEENLTQEG